MSRLRVPLLLRRHTGGARELDLPGATVGACIVELERRFPAASSELRNEEGRLRPSLGLYVNGQDVRYLAGLDTPLADGDELALVLPIAGGSAETNLLPPEKVQKVQVACSSAGIGEDEVSSFGGSRTKGEKSVLAEMVAETGLRAKRHRRVVRAVRGG